MCKFNVYFNPPVTPKIQVSSYFTFGETEANHLLRDHKKTRSKA